MPQVQQHSTILSIEPSNNVGRATLVNKVGVSPRIPRGDHGKSNVSVNPVNGANHVDSVRDDGGGGKEQRCAPKDLVRDESTLAFLENCGATELISSSRPLDTSERKDTQVGFAFRDVESGIQALAVNAIATDFPDIPQQDVAINQGQQESQNNMGHDEISTIVDSLNVPTKEFIYMPTNHSRPDDYDSDDGPPTHSTFRNEGEDGEINGDNENNESMIPPVKRGSSNNGNNLKSSKRKIERHKSNTARSMKVSSGKYQPIRPAQRPQVFVGAGPKRLQAMDPTACLASQGPSPMYVTPEGLYGGAPGMYVYPTQAIGPVLVECLPTTHIHTALPSEPCPYRMKKTVRPAESVSSKNSASDHRSPISDAGSERIDEPLVQPQAKLEHHSMLGRLRLNDGTDSLKLSEGSEKSKNGAGSRRSKRKNHGDGLKKRLVWSDKLHERFIKAVKAGGGVDKAVPRQLLKYMNVEGLTSEHVKSHLQKYRNTMKKAEEAVKMTSEEMEGAQNSGIGKCSLSEGGEGSILNGGLSLQQANTITGTKRAMSYAGSSAVSAAGSVNSQVQLNSRLSRTPSGAQSLVEEPTGSQAIKVQGARKMVQNQAEEEGDHEEKSQEKSGKQNEEDARRNENGLSGRSALERSGQGSVRAMPSENGRQDVCSRQQQQVETQLALQERTMRLQLQMQIMVHRMVTLQRKVQEGVELQAGCTERGEVKADREHEAITHEFKTVQRELERQQVLLKEQKEEQEKIRQDLILARDSETMKESPKLTERKEKSNHAIT
eukprot:Plantae.Rhodophyta-Hildenbrandia_rubra.ctg436.p1 GENE.Plantae.Rhodophyta-Hildenbrandia_rubra.ctg436~~Plantae.Rhodophyta-Hildenbrandia_rubra.ctg436.p1  ORF type:complete len:777 (+),score=158.47 Plantae.Rhodophyta-Hildenbrandia_rubra.ctg436:239-2569(+)